MESGRLLESFNSLQEAAESVGAASTSISNACLGYNRSCMGFYWSYNLFEIYESVQDKRKKRVYQLTLRGEVIAYYESVSQASRSAGISKTCIARVCRHEREQSGGYIWRYNI